MAELQNFVRDTNSSAVFGGDILIDLDKLPAGTTTIDLTEALPKNKVILGGYFLNPADDLAGGAGTVKLDIGAQAVVGATATTDIKGTVAGAILSKAYLQKDTDTVVVTLAPASGVAMGGKLVVKVLYV